MDIEPFLSPKIPSPWPEDVRLSWRHAVEANGKKRDYAEIVQFVHSLPSSTHTVEIYGHTDEGHPLFRISCGDIGNANPSALLTGGVHGYEPSGVKAVLSFMETSAPTLKDDFNFVSHPCMSPWSYERDQRWTPLAEDPNRNFSRDPGIVQIPECVNFMDCIERHAIHFDVACDMHETSDRDVLLRVMRAKRFGSGLDSDFFDIPQGFYLLLTQQESALGDAHQLLFGQSIIDEVSNLAAIAPEKKILAGKVNHGGVVLSPTTKGTLRSYLEKHAKLVAVTEAYPDHPSVAQEARQEVCIRTQIAAIQGALRYTKERHPIFL